MLLAEAVMPVDGSAVRVSAVVMVHASSLHLFFRFIWFPPFLKFYVEAIIKDVP